MDRFWDLLERSVIVQGLVTLLFTIVILVMLCLGRAIPDQVWIAFGAILGFWFGTKSQAEIQYHACKAQGKER
jgi:hypothetical protein